MRFVLKPVVLAMLFIACLAAIAEAAYYTVYLTRVEDNFYRIENAPKYLIHTEFCYHFGFWDRSILRWDYAGAFTNRIWFSDGTTCRVTGLYVALD